MVPLRRIDGGLRCNGRDYIRKGTPQKEGMKVFQEKGIEREKTKDYFVTKKSLHINERSILEPARGRVYVESSFFSFMLTTSILKVLSLLTRKPTLLKIHCIGLGLKDWEPPF